MENLTKLPLLRRLLPDGDGQNKKIVLLTLSLLCMLCVEIAFLVFANAAYQDRILDEDMATQFVHDMEMARQRTVLLPAWSYSTSLELDTSTFLVLPFYLLTGSIYTAHTIANTLLIFFTVYLIFCLFDAGEGVSALLASCLVLIPYMVGNLDYFNMMFFHTSHYLLKTLMPLLLIGLVRRMHTPFASLPPFIKLNAVLYLLLLFLCSFSSGVYVIVCGVLPVLIGYFLFQYYHDLPPARVYFLLALISVCVAGVGYYLNTKTGIDALGNGMSLVGMDDLHEHIATYTIAIFQLFGGVGSDAVGVLSYDGMFTLSRTFFVLCLFVSLLYTIYEILTRRASLRKALLTTVFLWNTAILFLSDTTYGMNCEYRYHLLGCIPLLCLFAENISARLLSSCRRAFRYAPLELAAVLAYLFVLFVTSARPIVARGAQTEAYDKWKPLFAYLEETDIEVAYLTDYIGETEVVRLLDYDGKTDFVFVNPNSGLSISRDYYARFDNTPVETEHAALVLTTGEYGEGMELFGHAYRLYDVVDRYYIYRAVR